MSETVRPANARQNRPEFGHGGRGHGRQLCNGRCRAGRVECFRETEIEHFDVAVGANLDIRRLQIAMNDSVIVCRFEGLRDLGRDPNRFRERNGATADAIGERRTLDQLHHKRGHRRIDFQAVDRRDMWMVQRRQHLRLAVKSGEAIWIAGDRRRQHLDRHCTL